jgi:hypothetical protein
VDLSESSGVDVTDLGTRGVAAADFDRTGSSTVRIRLAGRATIICWSSGGCVSTASESRRRRQVATNQGVTVAGIMTA